MIILEWQKLLKIKHKRFLYPTPRSFYWENSDLFIYIFSTEFSESFIYFGKLLALDLINGIQRSDKWYTEISSH